jgi:hypothetical protein
LLIVQGSLHEHSYTVGSALFPVLDIDQVQFSYTIGSAYFSVLDINQVHVQYSYTVGSVLFSVMDIDKVQYFYPVESALFPVLDICRPGTVHLHSPGYRPGTVLLHRRECNLLCRGDRPATVLLHSRPYTVGSALFPILEIDQVQFSYPTQDSTPTQLGGHSSLS